MTLNMDSKVRCSACVSLPSYVGVLSIHWQAMCSCVCPCMCVIERQRERVCLCVNISRTMIPVCRGHRQNRSLLSFFLQTMEEYMSKPAF